MHQPRYFTNIQNRASRRWDQLEGDPELAGPWRQLFRQVQSPRHVLSELLQNADDAGATEAAAEIIDGEFVFSHNGEDFNQEQFASLCRFGFSNKRNLHTIGFRGVGFKSTFSLGDEVHLQTPTLSVAFRKERFTQPEWIRIAKRDDKFTEVRVALRNERVEDELKSNLKEWQGSAASLLFFNNLRQMRIGQHEVRWESQGPGPVAGSEWMSVSSRPDARYLAIRSSEEEFPEEALQEIRDERMADDDEMAFPPCRIDLVLGIDGRIFVVLPTGVTTEMPFACNAPFVQDPARVQIKDPAMSPTNRWLLRRAGKLAADTMLAWVRRSDLSAKERCEAYRLFPEISSGTDTLERTCGSMIEKSFKTAIEGKAFLLTEDNDTQQSGGCLAVPEPLLSVWDSSQIPGYFGKEPLRVLSVHVDVEAKRKLVNAKHVETLSKTQVFQTLSVTSLKCPTTWPRLLNLWNYVWEGSWLHRVSVGALKVVPIQGGASLHSVDEVARIGEGRILSSQDVAFLSPHLKILDQDWIDFLSRKGKSAVDSGSPLVRAKLDMANEILHELRLDQSTAVGRLLQFATDSFIASEGNRRAEEWVRLAHLAAKLRAPAPPNFLFLTQDDTLQEADGLSALLADIARNLDLFVKPDWFKTNVISDAYFNSSETCSEEQWKAWALSSNSPLQTFVSLKKKSLRIIGRRNLEKELRRRGYHYKLEYHYKSNTFTLEDWDFPETHWNYWTELARNDDNFWSNLLTQILKQPVSDWNDKTSDAVRHHANNGRNRLIAQTSICPSWILKLRDLACLADTYGKARKPSELLMRTRETESLLGIEPFVDSALDNNASQKLLRLLGVGDKPTGPERLLERLHALANASRPLVSEIQKWCNSLDQIFDQCSTDEVSYIRESFSRNRLILTEEDTWAKSNEVFLSSNDYELSGAVLIHPSLNELSLWRKIGVAERPTADMEIKWLRGLRAGQRLDAIELRRARFIIQTYPSRVWEECGHWINLEGNWIKVDRLAYSLTMQSLVPWNHLFPEYKAKTADFRMLASDVCKAEPFSSLPRLGNVLQERPEEGLLKLPPAQTKNWMATLGNILQRLIFDETEKIERVRTLGHRLSQTKWQVAGGLRSLPYIDGNPAGTPKPIDALWSQETLYVSEGNAAKLANKVPQELGRIIDDPTLSDAIKMCYEREEGFILEYMANNFHLTPEAEVRVPIRREPESDDAVTREGGDTDSMNVHEEISPEDDRIEESHPVEESGVSCSTPPRQPAHRPPHESMIQRFARRRGFSLQADGTFRHEDGRIIGKTAGEAFPWHLYSQLNGVTRYYWDKDHHIFDGPLEIEADIWRLCEQNPTLYSLILSDDNGDPCEIRGHELVDMRNQDQLGVYPATYRLVFREAVE